MKTRNLLFGAMGLLLMASCAKDEVVDVNRDGDEIAFNVVTNSSTRANITSGGVYCNNNLPSIFHVWATSEEGENQANFIQGDKVIYLDTPETSQADRQTKFRVQHNLSALWTNTCLRYWPGDNKKVNFYAAVNAVSEGMDGYDEHYKFNWNNTPTAFNAPTIDVNVPEAAGAQKDLLYAVKKEQTKETNKGIVNLNFRHALSQVVFTAQNPSEKLYAEITGVSICNVRSTGTFKYPNNNTEGNIDGHTTGGDSHITDVDNPEESTPEESTPAPYKPKYDDGTWGTWENISTPIKYSLSFEPIIFQPFKPTEQNPTPVIEQLSGPFSYKDERNTTHAIEYNSNAMLLVPQTTEAWNPEAGKPGKEGQTGAYILVKCLIYNIAGDALDKTKDVCVWGKKEADGTYTAKEVAIPVKLDWTQGKKYIYSFIFGVSGGYDPDPDEPEPNPNDPDLVPIDFKITVDEFVDMDNNVAEADQQPQEVLQLLG